MFLLKWDVAFLSWLGTKT